MPPYEIVYICHNITFSKNCKVERKIKMLNPTNTLEKAQQIVSLLEGFSRGEWCALRDSIERAFDAQANSIKVAPGERLSRMIETEFTP